MIGSISAQIALLAFAATIAAGLAAENSATTILCRALVAMVTAMFVGKLVAWCVKMILRDHLIRKKITIDKAHWEAKKQKDAEKGVAARNKPVDAAVETG